MTAPKTSSERSRKHRATGKNLGLVLTDPAAIRSLDALSARLGGVTAAITAALIQLDAGPEGSAEAGERLLPA